MCIVVGLYYARGAPLPSRTLNIGDYTFNVDVNVPGERNCWFDKKFREMEGLQVRIKRRPVTRQLILNFFELANQH